LAGIKDFRFHDLRHTFASWYMMNGGDLYALANILGHRNIKMTERYAKLGKKHMGVSSVLCKRRKRIPAVCPLVD
jgi:integrase